MFENYTATASRHPSSLPLCDDDIFGPGWSVPRTSSPCEPLNHQISITQLSQQFSQMGSQAQDHLESSGLSYADNEFGRIDYVGSMSPSRRRIQRQHGVRMLCDPSHLRNIQDMVDKMIRSGEQCAVSSSRTISDEAPRPNADDEDYSSLDESHRNGSVSSVSSVSSSGSTMSCKRVDSTTGACVTKHARVKKSRNLRGFPKQH